MNAERCADGVTSLEVGCRSDLLMPFDAGWSVALRSVAGGVLALATAMGIGRFAYTPLLPAMQDAAHLSAGQAGVLASANFAGYLAGALLLTLVAPGAAARGRLLGTGLVTVALTTALMATTTNFAVWDVIRFACGVASAAVFILASDIVLGVLRRERRTSLSGWLYSGVGVGIVVSGAAAHVLSGPSGWRGGWLVLGILAVATVYPAWRWLSDGSGEASGVQRGAVIQLPSVTVPLALLIGAYTLAGGGYIVTGTFLVAIVDQTPGLSGIGADVWILVGLAVIPFTPLWAVTGRRMGYVPVLMLAYVAQACAIVLPVLDTRVIAVCAAAILFGGTFMAIAALTLTLVRYVAPGGSSAAIGLLTLGFSVGQIVAPALAGIAAGHVHSFRPALIAATVAMLLAGALVAVIGRYARTTPFFETEEA